VPGVGQEKVESLVLGLMIVFYSVEGTEVTLEGAKEVIPWPGLAWPGLAWPGL